MKLQSTPEIEKVIRNGFVSVIPNAIDAAALKGSGSSKQPTGVLNVSGIGSVADGTNGAAASSKILKRCLPFRLSYLPSI